ncbi:MAG TPA: peptide MFS transporter [Polyangia bacterium]|jgi:POT family proton-dependent oligopeptide transporter|nr:peptide MFS transporter [Polyangia bacterium]
MRTTAPPSGAADTAAPTQAHPTGLYVLFGAEAWERFSYYGMRALLVLYLTKHLQFNRPDALSIYATYTGLVYLTPIAGGFFADRVLGRRKAVLIGGILMALGHLAMAFEPLLHLALGLLILGNGFFKPNISTIVGGLYEEGDVRRDGGFTIFYMGINLGAYLAPLICGNLGEKVGWHYGFSAAAVGMACGLMVFVWGQKFLAAVGMPPRKARASETAATTAPDAQRLDRRDYLDVVAWVVAGAGLVWAVVTARGSLGALWAAVPTTAALALALLALATVIFGLLRGANAEESQQVWVVIILCVFNIFFWMGFEQAGGTMTLFADKQTDRVVGWGEIIVAALVQIGAGINIHRTTRQEKAARILWGVLTYLFILTGIATLVWGGKALLSGQRIEIAASQFQSINPLLIVALAPSFSRLWLRLDRGRLRTSTPTKMAIGMIILGLGFVVMFFGQKIAEANGKVSMGWLAAVYALHTMGELCLSPIGLSMVTKLAPARVVSLAMGLWFVSNAIANYLAGTLESILDKHHVPIYGFLIVSSIGPALLLLALTPLLKRWMHGRA